MSPHANIVGEPILDNRRGLNEFMGFVSKVFAFAGRHSMCLVSINVCTFAVVITVVMGVLYALIAQGLHANRLCKCQNLRWFVIKQIFEPDRWNRRDHGSCMREASRQLYYSKVFLLNYPHAWYLGTFTLKPHGRVPETCIGEQIDFRARYQFNRFRTETARTQRKSVCTKNSA